MNILLLMPDFFEYPKIIIEELQSRGYDVDFFCNGYESFSRYFSYKNIFRRVIRKFFPNYIREKDIIMAERSENEFYTKQLSNLKSNYDYVICIKGDKFPESQYSVLRTNYKEAKFVIYQWDDFSLLIKTKHFKWFDKKYSYNISDCENGFQYLPMFSKKSSVPVVDTKKYDIAIIGTIDQAHKKRLQVIERIYNKYKNIFRFYLYLYRKGNIETNLPSSTEKLPFDDYISALQSARCVIDIALTNQEGPTTRFNDALGTKTKVITTNKYIKKYPIFSDNILIIDEIEPIISEGFVTTPYCDNNLEFMSIEKWCDKILN